MSILLFDSTFLTLAIPLHNYERTESHVLVTLAIP
jgi:hypothetical protein